MIDHRPLESLGHFRNDWLSARYHFSFAGYYDPARSGLGPLKVWNDDTIAPGKGFGRHGHRDMEIITYVREGAIWHSDHLGNEGVTKAGEVQVMTAGKGILHAEYNRGAEPTKIFQIWIEPLEKRLPPRWETRAFPVLRAGHGLQPLASGRSAAEGALLIHQDATLYGGQLVAGQRVAHELEEGRQAYLVSTRGRYRLDNREFSPGDGVAITAEGALTLEAIEETELVLADLP